MDANLPCCTYSICGLKQLVSWLKFSNNRAASYHRVVTDWYKWTQECNNLHFNRSTRSIIKCNKRWITSTQCRSVHIVVVGVVVRLMVLARYITRTSAPAPAKHCRLMHSHIFVHHSFVALAWRVWHAHNREHALTLAFHARASNKASASTHALAMRRKPCSSIYLCDSISRANTCSELCRHRSWARIYVKNTYWLAGLYLCSGVIEIHIMLEHRKQLWKQICVIAFWLRVAWTCSSIVWMSHSFVFVRFTPIEELYARWSMGSRDSERDRYHTTTKNSNIVKHKKMQSKLHFYCWSSYK